MLSPSGTLVLPSMRVMINDWDTSGKVYSLSLIHIWPEEEAYLCTVEQLEETAKAHDITKTALIIVGDIVAHQHYGKSRLYAPDFETEFRKIKKSREKE